MEDEKQFTLKSKNKDLLDTLFLIKHTDPPFIVNEKLLALYSIQHDIAYTVYDNDPPMYQYNANAQHTGIEIPHWNSNSSINRAYATLIANKIYQHKTGTVYSATSLQKIFTNIDNVENETDSFYKESPLVNAIIQNYSNTQTPITFLYKNFILPINKPVFFFNKIYDGPNAKNIWFIGCRHYTKKQSSLIITTNITNNCYESSTNNPMPSQHFKGIIKNIVLHNSLNKGYLIIEMDKESKLLYEILFSLKMQYCSYSLFCRTSQVDDFKRLFILSDRLLIALTEKGELYKIDLNKKKAAAISVLDHEKKKIVLHNIVQNVSMPYLWLLLSVTNELYFLNLKDQKEKITFTKMLHLPASDNLWFDKDDILVKHKNITIPIPETKIKPSTVSIQYSFYKLFILLSKSTVSKLFQDNSNLK